MFEKCKILNIYNELLYFPFCCFGRTPMKQLWLLNNITTAPQHSQQQFYNFSQLLTEHRNVDMISEVPNKKIMHYKKVQIFSEIKTFKM